MNLSRPLVTPCGQSPNPAIALPAEYIVREGKKRSGGRFTWRGRHMVVVEAARKRIGQTAARHRDRALADLDGRNGLARCDPGRSQGGACGFGPQVAPARLGPDVER